jgi:hypothetical protein
MPESVEIKLSKERAYWLASAILHAAETLDPLVIIAWREHKSDDAAMGYDRY